MLLNNTSSHPVKKLEESMLIASEQIISFDHAFLLLLKQLHFSIAYAKRWAGFRTENTAFASCKMSHPNNE